MVVVGGCRRGRGTRPGDSPTWAAWGARPQDGPASVTCGQTAVAAGPVSDAGKAAKDQSSALKRDSNNVECEGPLRRSRGKEKAAAAVCAGLTSGTEACLGQCAEICVKRVQVGRESGPEDPVQHRAAGEREAGAGRAQCSGLLRRQTQGHQDCPGAESWSDGETGRGVRRKETRGKRGGER